MIINVDIPDSRVDQAVNMYLQKYQLDVPKTSNDKKDFLSKVLTQDLVNCFRNEVVEQKRREAEAEIMATQDIAKTPLETELETKKLAEAEKLRPEIKTGDDIDIDKIVNK